MAGVAQEGAGVSQHTDEVAQDAQLAQGDHLILHTDLVVVEPPGRAVLDLAGNLGALVCAQQGVQPLVVGGVQGVNDGLGQLIRPFPGIHQAVQGCVSLLLVCMMTGTIFCNICDTSEELMNRIDGWTMPLNILFFVLSGAELDLEVLAHPVTILVGVIYIIARSAGKYYGAAVSCRLTRQSKPITDNLGITLLPQAGVALGMALTTATLPDGNLARNVVLFAVLVYELVGPSLTKRSLLAVGDIKPEGRTSARTLNQKA